MKTFEQKASPFVKAGLIVGISFILGFLFDFLFYGKFPGLAFPIYVLLVIAGLLGITRLYGRAISRDVLWLIAPVFFFSAMVFVRANFLLTALNITAVMLLLLLIAQIAFSEPLSSFSIKDYLLTMVTPFFFIVALFKSFGDLLTLRGVKADKRVLGQIVTGVAITVPVLIVFFLLFASADLVFHRALSQIINFGVGPYLVFRTGLVLFAMSAFTGAYSYIFRKAEPGLSFPPAAPFERKPGSFGHIESSILLGSVNALFFTFILVQITYLFGGLANISEQGFTYAEYARKGFFELVAVAVIALAMLLLIEKFIAQKESGHSLLFKVLSSVFILQVMVILASSLTRMSLYEHTYGFTELRLFVHVFIFFIAAVYVALTYKIHIDDRGNIFTFKVFLLIVAFLAFMNALNPDSFVARQNMQRFRETGRIDAGYLGRLSDDSLAVTISLLENTNTTIKKQYATGLYETYRLERRREFSQWQSLNLSRLKAKELLKDREQEIKKLRR